MHHRRGALRELELATDIGGADHIRVLGGECRLLGAPQLRGNLRLQNRIGASRAATQMRIPHRAQGMTGAYQDGFNIAANLHAMLQRARRVERDFLSGGDGGPR